MAAPSPRVSGAVAAAFGFLAVAGGAFAAHAAPSEKAAEWLRTGAHWAAVHALAVLACIALSERWPRLATAPAFFLPGVVIFTGSLYALAAGSARWVGAITPIGGVLLLIGWAMVAWAFARGAKVEQGHAPRA